VHPHANGIISGITGAAGNLGGIVYAIVFRYQTDGTTTNYAKALYIIGAIMIGMNISVSWIRPIPKGQIGGH
jgi:NNP family nitrate/nitrite transporter-like MFS transporter